ncbi:hypothetical protein SCUCBS95973_001113 [Sporothrix curviconia]|uniref:Uncharacterized protein n=1 Tax=Sporothrix curviconia TaxID=1260050 RepID=A0ABP0AWC0_9PEZI
MTRSQSAFAPEIRVASPAPSPPAAEPAKPAVPVIVKAVADPELMAIDNDAETPAPVETFKEEQPNGTASHPRQQSPPPDENRIVEDVTVIDDDVRPSPTPVTGPRPRGRPPNSANRANARNSALTYASASVDLDDITYRQLGEDIEAYLVDLDFCQSQLNLVKDGDVTPQEARALQLRVLDLHHQVRSCEHRREMMEKQRLIAGGRPFNKSVPVSGPPRASWSGAGLANGNGQRSAPGSALKRPLSSGGVDQNGNGTNKRARAASEVSIQDTISVHSQDNAGGNSRVINEDVSDMEIVQYNGHANDATSPERKLFGTADGNHPGTKIQRLGLWYCQLCISEKYLYAGPDRLPSNPSKEIKDMGKLMTHYFDLHKEHTPEERLYALGEALQKNRGPFAYWLIKSRSQRVDDPAIMDDAISELKSGRVPRLLRDLCRAAAAFPGADAS